MKIGVFICHCGSNIAGTVDCGKVAEIAKTYPDVAFSTDTMYTCSEPGQEEIVAAIKEHKLDGVVVASCTPRMHEPTFRRTVERAGLNKYMFEMANIREHVSWIGKDKEANTNKAAELVRIAVEKLRRDNPLFSKSFESTKRVLVIGGGVAGIQAALDCADAGLDVLLVERESHIGGKMAKLDKTFPTVDCSSCILGPKMVDVAQHPKITLMAASEVTNVAGYVGNFTVTVKKKATYVDWSKCTGCGACMDKCPAKKTPDKFNEFVGPTTAINIPFPQAIPKKASINPEHCRKLTSGKCGVCAKVCPTGAINYEMKDEEITETVGAIVAATGYDLMDWTVYGEYGAGQYRRHHLAPVRAHHVRLRPDRRPHQAPVRRQGTQERRVHPVRGLPRQVHRPPLLLRLLLHVHRQAGRPDQGPHPRLAVLRVLHGHPRQREAL